MDHSILPPSNAEQWVNCAGSVQLNLTVPPSTPHPSALEGTVAHGIAVEMVEGYAKGQTPGRMSSAFMDTVREGVTITKEMTDAALMYAKHVGPVMQYARTFGGPNIGIERRVETPGIHSACFGTPDFWLYNSDEKYLHVKEFKYGHGVVEVFENWQLLAYVQGIVTELAISPLKIFLTVIQPRAPHRDGPIRTWTVNDPTDLDPYFERLRASAESAMSADPSTCSGSWCRRCPSLLVCDTARNAEGAALDHIGGLTTMATTDDQIWFRLFNLKRASDIAKHAITALESEVEAKMRSGTHVPRFKMEPKTSSPFWTIPHDQIIEFGESCGIDLNVDKTMTPTQTKAAGASNEMVDAFSKRESRGVRLKFDDLKQARYIFGAGNRKEQNETHESTRL